MSALCQVGDCCGNLLVVLPGAFEDVFEDFGTE
jgi:hypothetical protein